MSRSALAAMLRDFGIGHVVQVARVQDARRRLEHERYDVVVSEYHFEHEPMSGQDLFDDLRLANLLPLSTVTLMISAEASYLRVAEAAEVALDAYLIKPHTEQALRERLLQGFERKAALADIHALVEQRHWREAAPLCELHVQQRHKHWVAAARIGAELWLRLGDARSAAALFDTVLATRALPWARLGIARSEYAAGAVRKARRTLESLLSDQPGYADAYDVMGRVLLEQGEGAEAVAALRRALALTPGNVTRALKFGVLAFYHGHADEAAQALQLAMRLGLNSQVYDLQGVVLLGTLHFDRGDRRGLAHCLGALRAARRDQPASARLRRFEDTLAVLSALLDRQVGEAVALTQRALAELQADDYEFEAACNLLSVLARLLAREVRLDDWPVWLAALADRFAVSRTSCDLLCRAAQGVADFEVTIRARHAGIGDVAEAAVAHAVAGEPRRAVVELLAHGERTRNAKLLDLAQHTLERHRERIEDAVALADAIERLNRRYRSYGTQLHLGAPVAAAVPPA
jgi:tetratricopeptide (TPR) repeat protein